jgi:uncharacterized damage-inducible protein DinB
MTAPMITPDYCRTMGRYNLWQNRSLVACADALSADERARDRGAFWGSIAGTLSHLLWGDSVWMSRFEGSPRPPGTIAASPGFAADWADGLAAADLAGDLVWFSGVLKREVSMPKALQVVHFFNHQTHHRGQVHAMLTAAGRRPEDTDLIFMPTML